MMRQPEQPPSEHWNDFVNPVAEDETAIEQVIDRRRKQQSVLAVEALGVAAIAPWFAVARAQVRVL